MHGGRCSNWLRCGSRGGRSNWFWHWGLNHNRRGLRHNRCGSGRSKHNRCVHVHFLAVDNLRARLGSSRWLLWRSLNDGHWCSNDRLHDRRWCSNNRLHDRLHDRHWLGRSHDFGLNLDFPPFRDSGDRSRLGRTWLLICQHDHD